MCEKCYCTSGLPDRSCLSNMLLITYSADLITAMSFYTGYHKVESIIYSVCGMRLSVFFDLSPRDHVHSALKQLHWLPVVYRIKYKLSLMMYLIHTDQCPVYLRQSVSPVSNVSARRRLRSAAHQDYVVPRTRTKFGERAFSVAGPKTWNSLSSLSVIFGQFKRSQKTHLFSDAHAD